MPREALILFTRLPLPGRTKTRLMPWLTPEQCAALHRVMLADIVVTLKHTGKDVFVFYTPEGDLTELRGICGDVLFALQQGIDLGERMDRAIRDVLGRGYVSCLLLGSDVPAVTGKDLETASELLLTHDVVLAPTEDGGYWLVGLKRPCSQIFTHQPYGTADAFTAVLAACKQAGRTFAVAPTLRDVDLIEDLRYYAKHPGRNMPHTQKWIEALG
jgi:rSAM/selenodomain-associated transferase 1